MTDPLAGLRERINSGELDQLNFPDVGKGPPMKKGDVYELRACVIEITTVKRLKQGPKWLWRVLFTRYPKHGDRVHVLVRGAGTGHGYAHDDKMAMRAQDENPTATLDLADPNIAEREPGLARRVPHPVSGEPPEPEAVPPHEVGTYTGDKLARARYEREVTEERMAYEALPLEQRLVILRKLADEKHVDISSEVRVIERRLASIENKVLERKAA